MSDSERLTDEQLTAIEAADKRRHDGPMEIDGNMTVAWYEFIAVASWAIPALVAEVKRLRADVTRLNGCIDAVMRHEGQQEGS